MGAHAVVQEELKRLVATACFEVVKPLGDVSWNQLGNRLRDIRRVSHRLLNVVIRTKALAEHQRLKKCPSLTEAIRKQIVVERDGAAAQLKKKNIEPRRRDQLERMAEFDLPGSVVDACQRKAGQLYDANRKDIWSGDKSLPSFGGGAPIFIRDGGWSIRQTPEGYVLDVKLYPGRVPDVSLAIAPDGGSAFAHAKRMADGCGVKLGDLKIIYVERKKKWLARPSYSFDAAPVKGDPNRVVAVHRGVRNFLTVGATDGDIRALADGGDILAFKRQMSARGDSLRRHRRELGGGAKGHGEARRIETYRALQDKEERWVRTKCQQVAAAVVKFAQRKGAGVVAIEDYSTIDREKEQSLGREIDRWPWAILKDCIAWACKKSGLVLREVLAAYLSSTCPKCGNVDTAQKQGNTFLCSNVKCLLKRPADYVACWNMVTRAGDPTAFDKAEEVSKKLVRGLSPGRSGATPRPEREGESHSRSRGRKPRDVASKEAVPRAPARAGTEGPVGRDACWPSPRARARRDGGEQNSKGKR